jgi:nitroimidazol reductase NimA-like FMN-containing flavoprotein (pyridoxamine 5'-phosphate oxidase superfamily)
VTPEARSVRRRDRAKDDAFVVAALARVPWGTLAVTDGSGPPHVNTNLFVHVRDPDRIYLHTARTGALADAVRRVPDGAPAAFTAAVMGRLLPAAEALEFSVEYAGVTATGRVVEVSEEPEAEGALQALLDRYAPHLRPGRDYRPIVPAELARTAVFRLDVESWSGKQKVVGDHEGSFTLPMPEPPIEAG